MKKEMKTLSARIYALYQNHPRFSRPSELLDALAEAKRQTGRYPVYTKSRSADSFVRFLSKKELDEFKAFGTPRWKSGVNKRNGLKEFEMEIADTEAGGMFPNDTPYEVSGKWITKGKFDENGSKVKYDVSLFIDRGWHIDHQTVYAKKPMSLKKVLSEAVAKSIGEKGKRFDGYWF